MNALSHHFAELRKVRRRSEDLPLFALEHGLNQTEIQDLSEAIRRHIQNFGANTPAFFSLDSLRGPKSAIGIPATSIGRRSRPPLPAGCCAEIDHGCELAFERFTTEFGGRGTDGRLGRALLDHMLAHHTRHPPERPPTATRADLIRTPSLVLQGPLGIAHVARRGDCGAQLERLGLDFKSSRKRPRSSVKLLQHSLSNRMRVQIPYIHRATLQRIGQDLERERLGSRMAQGCASLRTGASSHPWSRGRIPPRCGHSAKAGGSSRAGNGARYRTTDATSADRRCSSFMGSISRDSGSIASAVQVSRDRQHIVELTMRRRWGSGTPIGEGPMPPWSAADRCVALAALG